MNIEKGYNLNIFIVCCYYNGDVFYIFLALSLNFHTQFLHLFLPISLPFINTLIVKSKALWNQTTMTTTFLFWKIGRK